MTIFSIDKKSLNKIKKFYKNAPKEFKQATASVLNSLAFTTRKYDIENIERSMIVRNKRFVESSIRVKQTRITDINKQKSIVATIARDNFTGWTEQEYNKPTEQKKQFTVPGRMGSKKKRVPTRYRMQKGRKFVSSETISPGIKNAKSKARKTAIFLRMMARRKREPFFIHQPIGAMKKGLYEFKSKRLTLISSIERIKQPKRVRFRTSSLRSLKVRNDIDKIWARHLKRIVNRYK